jgi:hypothetical protein
MEEKNFKTQHIGALILSLPQGTDGPYYATLILTIQLNRLSFSLTFPEESNS